MRPSAPPRPAVPGGPPLEGTLGTLNLISGAIGLWLKHLCSRLDHLDLELIGTGRALLAGHLDGVRLEARGGVIEGIALNHVQLRSDPIRLDLGPLLRGRPLQLRERFVVTGSVCLDGEGLTQSLAHPAWRHFSDTLALALLDRPGLDRYELDGDQLTVVADDGRRAPCRLVVHDGGLSTVPGDLVVPLDPAMQISEVVCRDGRIELSGRSIVSAAGAAPG